MLAVELATARADRAGGISYWGSRRAVCTVSSLSSPTITPGCGRRCARFWRRRPISAAMGISSETRSTTCRAGSTTTACRSCAGWEPVLGPAKPDPGDRRELAEARRDLAAWRAKWSGKYPKLTGWVEENIDETLTPAFALGHAHIVAIWSGRGNGRSLSALGGGEGRGEVGDSGPSPAHLTFPRLRRGPLLSPLKGGEGFRTGPDVCMP